MALRVVGAGLGRTGTHSLKLALEQLLGGPCYHMLEVFGRPQDVPRWQRAVDGDPMPVEQWDEIFGDYVAAVDWPASAMVEADQRGLSRRDHPALDALVGRRLVQERDGHDLRDHAAGAGPPTTRGTAW